MKEYVQGEVTHDDNFSELRFLAHEENNQGKYPGDDFKTGRSPEHARQ
jgi:hypothetical protein